MREIVTSCLFRLLGSSQGGGFKLRDESSYSLLLYLIIGPHSSGDTSWGMCLNLDLSLKMLSSAHRRPKLLILNMPLSGALYSELLGNLALQMIPCRISVCGGEE